jgi:uncharacterized protein YndB with AHSA1/START domain
MPATGSYEMVNQRPIVRFERIFPHPVQAAWRALTESSELAQWFPTSVEFEALQAGAGIDFRFANGAYPAMRGRVLEVDAPHRLVFMWGNDELSFELEPRDGGAACRLLFCVVLDTHEKAARDAAGWDVCLGELERLIAGQPTTPPGQLPTEAWIELYEEYERHGLPASAPLPTPENDADH